MTKIKSEYLSFIKNYKFPRIYMSSSTPSLPIEFFSSSLNWNLAESSQTHLPQMLIEKLLSMARLQSQSLVFYPGATQAVFQTLLGHFKPGETIIVNAPYYEPYIATINLLGLKAKLTPHADDMNSNLDFIIESDAEGVLLTNPNFFSGQSFADMQIKKIINSGKFVIIDEVMRPLSFNGSLTGLSELGERAVIVNGLSKSLGLSSLRFGWTISSQAIAKQNFNMGQMLHTEMPTLSLEAAGYALESWDQIISHHMKTIQTNRSLFQDSGLRNHIGGKYDGGHLLSLKIPSTQKSSRLWCEMLLKKDIGLLSGHWFGADHLVRLSLLTDPIVFKNGLHSLEQEYV